MKAESTVGNRISELPMVASLPVAELRSRDLARGWKLVVVWGGPVGLILLASVVGPLAGWSFREIGVLLVGGTAWLGASCLTNARKCGRTHCWIDGVGLPILAGVGALTVLGLVSLPWNTYGGILWAIIITGFVVECALGPYLLRRPA